MQNKWIWESEKWPDFFCDLAVLAPDLAECRKAQGALLQRASELGVADAKQAESAAYLAEAISTSRIEGEDLNLDSLRESIAVRLGLGKGVGPITSSMEKEDGVVHVLMDATKAYEKPLDHERLFQWHAALFPSGRSRDRKIEVASYSPEQMQIFQRRHYGKEKLEYVAPPPARTQGEMGRFLDWFGKTRENMDGLVRSAQAHLHFELIHPFEDGNGPIGRAIADMALAQDEKTGRRFYSLSAQMNQNRKTYYQTFKDMDHKMDLDMTPWVAFHVESHRKAIIEAGKAMDMAFERQRFWAYHKGKNLNPRQTKAVGKLLEGFKGKFTNKKYQSMTKANPSTAKRDLVDMVEKGFLSREGEGRGSHYLLIRPRKRASYLENVGNS